MIGLAVYVVLLSYLEQAEAFSISIGQGHLWKKVYVPRRLAPHLEDILMSHFEYYRSLSVVDQKRFQSRLAVALKRLKIISRDQLVITDEMRVLVAASLVKLTFGYRRFLIAGFTNIILYPSEYYSHATKSTNKGETHFSGMVVLSWEDTLSGIQITNDNLHLAIHEFSHALWLALVRDKGVDLRLKLYQDEWKRLIAEPNNILRWKAKGFLRPYAFTNAMELFACAVETFFESPKELNQTHPELYKVMRKILNQDLLKMQRA
ncbi:MAG: zinc-dependent peptidase [Sphingobacteriaceae bacterium]|nr:zinc-dependent peptidase [Sphingobacteriaceae bacterium]